MKKLVLTVATIAALMFSCAKQNVKPKEMTIEEKNAPFQNKFGKVKIYTSDVNEPFVWFTSQAWRGKGNWAFYHDSNLDCNDESIFPNLTLSVGVPSTYTVYSFVDNETKDSIKASWTGTIVINYEGECKTIDIRQ